MALNRPLTDWKVRALARIVELEKKYADNREVCNALEKLVDEVRQVRIYTLPRLIAHLHQLSKQIPELQEIIPDEKLTNDIIAHSGIPEKGTKSDQRRMLVKWKLDALKRIVELEKKYSNNDELSLRLQVVASTIKNASTTKLADVINTLRVNSRVMPELAELMPPKPLIEGKAE